MDKETSMLAMSIELACGEAWRTGKAKREDGEWWGPHPVVELHSEGIDALNYLSELERTTKLPHDIIEGLRVSILQVVQGARMAAEVLGIMPGKTLEPLALDPAVDPALPEVQSLT